MNTSEATVDRSVEGSTRRSELLDLAYAHVLQNGLADMSLRPLAKAIGSSPRVLLYLFESKDGLVRALLGRARHDELAALAAFNQSASHSAPDLARTAREVWDWLAAPNHRAVLVLWAEAYVRSLVEPDGPWAGFADRTVHDWLGLLAAQQAARGRGSKVATHRRTALLALLRGALLDLLATGDSDRTGSAVELGLTALSTENG